MSTTNYGTAFVPMTRSSSGFKPGSPSAMRKFVMCIGCFEKRLGRQLTREDFKAPPNRLFGVPPSYRFRSRWKARSAGERI